MIYPFGSETHPWVTCRDEMDVMAEELEELFHPYEHHETSYNGMQRLVLKEQLEAEDMAEAELMMKWGPDLTLRESAFSEEAASIDLSHSLKELLHQYSQRDPLYVMSFMWATHVFSFVKEQTAFEGEESRDLFRILANVKLIPLKWSTHRLDDLQDDRFLHDVIKKEQELALIYLERVLESMRSLITQGFDLMIPFERSGCALHNTLAQAHKQFGHAKGGSGQV